MNKIPRDQFSTIKQMYVEELKTLLEISRFYGVSREAIAKNLRKQGVEIQNGNTRLASRGVNTKYFDKDTEGAAYFYGLMLADGCLTEPRNRLGISLQSDDSYILDTLKEELNLPTKVSHSARETGEKYSQLGFTVPEIVNTFKSLGFTSRKSTNEVAPDRFKSNKHFWRGIVDGDGSIGKKTSRVYVCGSQQLCDQFLDYCKSINPSINTKTVLMKGELYRVTVTGIKAAMILHELYSNSNFKLFRKYDLALETVSKYPEVTHVF